MRVHRHHSAELQFELAFADPAPSLAGVVRRYAGWIDWSPVQRGLREVPSGDIPLVILFQGKSNRFDIFTSGLHDSATIVKSDGPTAGVQVDFTTLGARRFFNRPLHELRNRTISLDDLLGSSARLLQAELHDAPTWEARFAILDRDIGARVGVARSLAPELVWSWQRLTQTAGRATIASVVRDIGWSERHFAREFERQLGMRPKAFARLVRFTRAVRRLTAHRDASLADLALACGYYDQAHFTREFHAFAGITPTELLLSRSPDESGFFPEP